ncbi:hypothetical protein [Psychrobacter sp. UBA6291]|uniref:hypothetical protein n=1 Tax=Psychrobacter sp. UBA6291 TaxID=1947357 RepID=UPI0025797CBB|nr:hypothetical protein [Psychrobacter sp. UBA6291]
MIVRKYIENNLKQLNKLYFDTNSHKRKLYYSKLAILELCGWIEESMDNIIEMCANRLLKLQATKTHVKKQIIDRNYGFEYKNHFIKMLSSVIGFMNIERLEKKLDASKNALLLSALGTLKNIRNAEAHTHLKGVTRHVDSPSITLKLFSQVFNGLKDIEIKLKLIKC